MHQVRSSFSGTFNRFHSNPTRVAETASTIPVFLCCPVWFHQSSVHPSGLLVTLLHSNWQPDSEKKHGQELKRQGRSHPRIIYTSRLSIALINPFSWPELHGTHFISRQIY